MDNLSKVTILYANSFLKEIHSLLLVGQDLKQSRTGAWNQDKNPSVRAASLSALHSPPTLVCEGRLWIAHTAFHGIPLIYVITLVQTFQ